MGATHEALADAEHVRDRRVALGLHRARLDHAAADVLHDRRRAAEAGRVVGGAGPVIRRHEARLAAVRCTTGHSMRTAGQWGPTRTAAGARVPGAVISWRLSETCARAEGVEGTKRRATGPADRGTSMPVRGLWTKRRARRSSIAGRESRGMGMGIVGDWRIG